MTPSSTTINLSITIPNLPNSPWLNTLGIHFAPNLLEANDIRRVITQAGTNIALIDQEITRIKDVLARVELQRNEMYGCSAVHKSLLAPVRRCPDEILSEIFTHCNSARGARGYIRRRMPWIVGVICKKWREVAVTTTALWSDITVEHFEESGSAQRAAEMAQELLRRTGVSRPISFQIWSHRRASLSDFTRVILPAILPSSNRWHHLDLSLSPDEINCLSPMNGALSSLESLKIYPGERPGESICDLFKIAPRLSRLKMTHGVGGFAFPWTQLTDFSADSNLNLHDCLAVLSDCPNLVSGVFETVRGGVRATSRFRQGLLHHAHLCHLKLQTFFCPAELFDCLSTPALRTIHLIDEDSDPFHEALVSFLLRSSCAIVSLIWDADICSIQGVGPVIRVMPELEELEVIYNCGAQFARQLLLDLTLDSCIDENFHLCSRLHTIRIFSADGFDKVVLLEFVKSRRQVHVSSQRVTLLRSVMLRTRRKETDKVFLAELQLLRDEGLDIKLLFV